ncbi:uncharacterized protein LOC118745791 [Rhagoletis pomonella]|uniref:uncharacterized protein LOC118745791 n=1 Tax=Rhagoletis pomonella TaxID=28610 RepID=UPI0017855B6A|nr:uncharacterized protein LOC118745791 [Rhagoletis pomonella]
MLEGIEHISKNLLAQNTIIGWILSDQIPNRVVSFSTQVEQNSNKLLESQQRKFWEVEEVPTPNLTSHEDKLCEELYQSTTSRTPEGRYRRSGHLYDKSSHLFRNKLLKEKAWDAVACAVGVPVTNCQTRWKSLRDRFVRETGLQKKKSGSGAEDGATWQYLEAMDFMRDFVAPRKTFSNLDFTSQEEDINGISPCNVTETSYYEEYEVSSPLPSVAANDTE